MLYNEFTVLMGLIMYLLPFMVLNIYVSLEGIDKSLLDLVGDAFGSLRVPVLRGGTWTTDAPFRETPLAIEHAKDEGLLAVEMETAALYAFAQARGKPVICFAHVTNQMAVVEGDFEKGEGDGSRDALELISLTAKAWLAKREQ